MNPKDPSIVSAQDTRPVWLRSKPLPWLAALLLGLIIGVAARHEITHQSATLDVEALITKGAIFHVYYNNQWTEPQLSAIRPNQWTHYRFTVPAHIISLRFAPSDETHAQTYVPTTVINGHHTRRSPSLDPLQLMD